MPAPRRRTAGRHALGSVSKMPEAPAQFTKLDPDADSFQLLRRELGVTSFGINMIALRPRQRLRVHRHERQEEVYLVLAGELTLIVEGSSHVLGVGELARVAPEARRQLTNAGSEPSPGLGPGRIRRARRS